MIHFYVEDSECELGWVPFNRYCYKMTTGKKYWPSSEKDCIETDAHLASVHSEEENEFLIRFASSHGVISYFYIGGYKDGRGSKRWTDGSNFDYENLSRPTWSNCTTIIATGPHSGIWTGMYCADPDSNKFYGVCKKSMKGKFITMTSYKTSIIDL